MKESKIEKPKNRGNKKNQIEIYQWRKREDIYTYHPLVSIFPLFGGPVIGGPGGVVDVAIFVGGGGRVYLSD